MKARVLVVEDDVVWGDLLARQLSRTQLDAQVCRSGSAALTALSGADVDVVLTDLQMPGMNGIELCNRITEARTDVPVVVITAFGSMEMAIQAMRAGAWDFVTKPIDADALIPVLERAVQHKRLTDEVKRLRQEIASTRPGSLLGESPAIKQLIATAARIQDSDAAVLITGESGTGKEVVARHIHDSSRRRNGPFVAVDCAAIPPSLMEAELFGHAKGAFTDARTDRLGLFQQARGGTLFLDEVGELPPALQPKLLRALQEKVVRAVGANEEVPCDVRIIAATNRDLEQAVEEERFRGDLLFRLNVIGLELPPLRMRGNDILLLAQHFVRRVAEKTGKAVKGISPPAAAKLLAYGWPGNVRELLNCIERAVAFATLDEVQVDDLPDRVKAWKKPALALDDADPSELITLEELERRHIERVMAATGGNRTMASKVLGIDRKTLWRKLPKRNATPEPADE